MLLKTKKRPITSLKKTTVGEYNWGGAAGTKFWIDPKEDMIGIFMIQILPNSVDYGSEFRVLAYQAVAD